MKPTLTPNSKAFSTAKPFKPFLVLQNLPPTRGIGNLYSSTNIPVAKIIPFLMFLD
jgi:hypothetical protein